MTRHEIFGQLAVFTLMMVAIAGSALVLDVKYRGGTHLLPLVDGAYVGGLIATGAALAFVGLAFFVRSRSAVAMQAVVSVLLAALHAYSIYSVQSRIDVGEAADEAVLASRGWYFAALLVQVVAAVVGFVRFRRQKS